MTEDAIAPRMLAAALAVGVGVLVLGGVTLSVRSAVASAEQRLLRPEADRPKVLVAAQAVNDSTRLVHHFLILSGFFDPYFFNVLLQIKTLFFRHRV